MFFWVNQGKTYKEESQGGYLWAPVQNSSGRTFFHWENMLKLRPGDIVFNYYKGYLIGYCEIQSKSYIAGKPVEFNVDVEWENEGHMADAKYFLFERPLKADLIYSLIEEDLPSKYGPLNVTYRDGELSIKGNQGYLYELNDEIGKTLFELFKIDYEPSIFEDDRTSDVEEEYKVPDVTSRKGLVTSRVGQGEYRRRILKRWQYKCAVTGSGMQEILIASHIVPWRESTDSERLDVHNGILLSPVYDALFDTNLISFEDDGRIILSKALKQEEFLRLGVDGKERISNLTDKNKEYLKRHRSKLKTLW